MKTKVITFILFLSLISCEKEHCWECTHTSITDVGFVKEHTPTETIMRVIESDTLISVAIRCDLTESEILSIMRWSNFTSEYDYKGFHYILTNTVHCMKLTCVE